MKSFLFSHQQFRHNVLRSCVCYLFLASTMLAVEIKEQPATSPTPVPKTNFLNIGAINFFKILPPPPKPDSKREAEDREILHDAIATRTKKQVTRATVATKDSVFDYAAALGPNFNPAKYPHVAALFKKIKNDATVAIHSAKSAFHRARPETWSPSKSEDKNKKQNGYAYPSGHSTRAFLWASLLDHLFPAKEKQINTEARQKAWNRVVLGRHYPDDVYAGEIYGKYLADEFMKNPKFQKEWNAIQEEVQKTPVINAPPQDVTPVVIPPTAQPAASKLDDEKDEDEASPLEND